jgi:CRISPR-associated endonuclease/helicase Cas3
MKNILSNSSDIISNKLPSITSIVQNTQYYYAHKYGKTNSETLSEHIELVLSYTVKIIESQNIDPIIDIICLKIANQKIDLAETIKLLFLGVIAYHDLGKINPNFQVEKMENPNFNHLDLSIKSQHSVLSAFLYLHYFAYDINTNDKLDNNSKIFLFGLIQILCYPIAKHHGSFIENETRFTKEGFDEMFQFVENCKFSLPLKASQNLFLQKEKWIKNVSKGNNFYIYSLIKLSYSLLTACDYYATNEYMADIIVNDFGVLDEKLKQNIISNFSSLKPYNRELLNDLEHYTTVPFSNLQERSKENLNTLRQKLNAEVINNLRKNPNSNWYYIEAPTGSGKTNLSLTCISELLKIDKSLNKVFYVFPFTTLITQTFQGIQETIGLSNNEMIQLHSKAGFHEKETQADGLYGKEKRLYLDNLFVNYPFCVTSHVRFFDILKGNSKDTNYMHHRLCNSIVVIDELQTYNPKHWDKLLFFIENYATLFNMRFIIMSATLPKIDVLSETAKGKFVNLTPNKHLYFTNTNFAGRIEFDFSLLEKKRPEKDQKDAYLIELAKFIEKESEIYYKKYGKARILIEFITKNTASVFFELAKKSFFAGYKFFFLSGDILEPQRKIIINELKAEKYDKVLLVSTQVVEAGVDIDMDLGFKDRSLLDSDEQLAGRVNRNASKNDCKVYLFDCDSSVTIYGKDKRYQQQQKEKELYFGFKEILQNKTFDKLYQKVFEDAKKSDWTDGDKLETYIQYFDRLDFKSINNEFKLIEDNNSEQLFIPLEIEITYEDDIDYLNKIKVLTENHKISGEKLFDQYISVIKNQQNDFTLNQINLKKLTGLMSRFTIAVYPKVLEKLADKFDKEKEQYGYKYLLHYEDCYSLEMGFHVNKIESSIIL